MDDNSLEALCRTAEEHAWTVLRATAQEHGMPDPSTFCDRDQQLLWMGIKAGTATGVEVAKDMRNS